MARLSDSQALDLSDEERLALLGLAEELKPRDTIKLSKAEPEFDAQILEEFVAAASGIDLLPEAITEYLDIIASKDVNKPLAIALARRITNRDIAYKSKKEAVEAIRGKMLERYRDAQRTAALGG